MKGVFPEVVVTVLGIPVRDTVIFTWFMIMVVTAAAYALGRSRPGALDMLVEFILDTVSSVMGRPAEPFLPMLGTLAVFIAVGNTIGAVPVVISPTHDINTAAALALLVFFAVHYFGIRDKGVVGYLKDLASPVFTLPLELIGQFSRTLSLTLRLFGNVLSTAMIVAVIFSLLPLIVPLPLIAFSIFTGLLQAYIFTVLAAVYIGAAVASSRPASGQKERS